MKTALKLVPALAKKTRLASTLRQSLHILHLPLVDLREFLQAQVEENPLLEFSTVNAPEPLRENPPEEEGLEAQTEEFNPQKEAYQQTLITSMPTLYEHLLRQLHLNKLKDSEYALGEYLIGNLNSDGYLRVSLEDIAQTKGVSIAEVERILSLIQTFDPSGVGARNLCECLLLQLQAKKKEDTQACRIIRAHLPDLEKKKYKEIARALRISLAEVKVAVEEIRRLEPKPGRSFGANDAVKVIPDAYLEIRDKDFSIHLNQEEIPKVRINRRYQKILSDRNTPDETRQFLKKKMEAALWVIQAIGQRKKTLKKIIKAIVERQKKAICTGLFHLHPLTLKDIAAATGMHASTVSRAVAYKYIHTDYGTFCLKDFFSGKIKTEKGKAFSRRNIKFKIASLIQNENKKFPLTDTQIQTQLRRKSSLALSRRTIAKYRQELKIPPTYLRKEPANI